MRNQWSAPLIFWFSILKIQILQFVKPTTLPSCVLMSLLLSSIYPIWMKSFVHLFLFVILTLTLPPVCFPPPSVSADPSVELHPGSKVTLQCEVNGLSPSSTIQWQRPDGSSLAGPSQTVEPVALSDAGTWACTFTYGGQTYTQNLPIKVKGRTLFCWSLCLFTYKSSLC